jgi:hypothetical protein
MKPSLVPLLIGLGIMPFGIRLGFAADDAKKIPLDSVYTTTRQTDAKDALPQLKDFPQPNLEGKSIAGKPVIFLVNGKDFPAAVKASGPFIPLDGDAKTPDPKTETKAGEHHWVGAYLGSNGSSPPAYRVQSVEIDGTKVRVTYETIKRNSSTLDYWSYFVWAPLGTLSPGEYTLELYDVGAGKVTATGKNKVVKE